MIRSFLFLSPPVSLFYYSWGAVDVAGGAAVKNGCCNAVLQAIRRSGSYCNNFCIKSTPVGPPSDTNDTKSVIGNSLHCGNSAL